MTLQFKTLAKTCWTRVYGITVLEIKYYKNIANGYLAYTK